MRSSVKTKRAKRFVARLGEARIGTTYNQYADSPLRRRRLAEYLEARLDAPLLLVGEAAGYRGARVSGLPFTSERQLTGRGPAEATATIVHRVLERLGLVEDVLLWNAVPTHPGTSTSNRPPTRAEVAAAEPFLVELARGRRVVAVGRLAAAFTGAPYVRHPSHGGATAFEEGLGALTRAGMPVRVSAWRASEWQRRSQPSFPLPGSQVPRVPTTPPTRGPSRIASWPP